jgi:hypothetical protein
MQQGDKYTCTLEMRKNAWTIFHNFGGMKDGWITKRMEINGLECLFDGPTFNDTAY